MNDSQVLCIPRVFILDAQVQYVYQSQLHSSSHLLVEVDFIMVQLLSLATICSSLLGLSNAAALGSAEEYADGSVHARIMGMKMVSLDAVTLL